jgi:hypothetical protein
MLRRFSAFVQALVVFAPQKFKEKFELYFFTAGIWLRMCFFAKLGKRFLCLLIVVGICRARLFVKD